MNKKFFKINILTMVFVLTMSINCFSFDTNLNSDNLILVNYQYPVSKDYKPLDEVDIANYVNSTKSKMILRESAAQELIKMFNDMKKENINLYAISGYRSFDYQKNLFENAIKKQMKNGLSYEQAEQKVKTVNAKPGTSEHQLGLAIDVSNNFSLSQDFENTDAGAWIKQNCYDYGFIVRYPNDKTDITKIIYEPWHLRYVGLAHAKYMQQNNLSLEEYIDVLKEQKIIEQKVDNFTYKIYYTTNVLDEFDNIIDVSEDNTGGFIITTRFINNDTIKQHLKSISKNYCLKIWKRCSDGLA